MSKNQGKRNRERGSEFERECVKLLHNLGYRTARKTGSIQSNGLGDPDIAGVPFCWLSCKRWKSVMRWAAWWRDADARTPAHHAAMILHRGDRGEIYCSLRLKDLPAIMQGFEDSASASKLMRGN